MEVSDEDRLEADRIFGTRNLALGFKVDTFGGVPEVGGHGGDCCPFGQFRSSGILGQVSQLAKHANVQTDVVSCDVQPRLG